ncbi:hypothetical protein AZE42_09885 [Rhizopogon vesiculosus]|uniref:Uncharacterized protein n=1 Tax=Rhizopogon vesiculosus TaxID=180088 RepID=A0A1J8PLH0_9AGAM|nr:hypothetical protein AZE42_09885 [Rhizopogon vesiculosus]
MSRPRADDYTDSLSPTPLMSCTKKQLSIENFAEEKTIPSAS